MNGNDSFIERMEQEHNTLARLCFIDKFQITKHEIFSL